MPVKIEAPAGAYPSNDLMTAELRLEIGMDVYPRVSFRRGYNRPAYLETGKHCV
jgi:hypothetical protein